MAKYLSDTPSALIDFNTEMTNLSKLYGEAKDNVKFLQTLERQFKNLNLASASDGLKGLEETLPSLMNGLRLVWIISRHYKTDEKMKTLIETISNEIADKVENYIKIPQLLKLNDDIPYKKQLEDAEEKIAQGRKILASWKALYKSTKQQIEDEGGSDRWVFQPKPIVERITHMIDILENLEKIAGILKKFLVFLDSNLKAVTNNSEGIDNLVKEVKTLVLPFEASQNQFNVKNYKILIKNILF